MNEMKRLNCLIIDDEPIARDAIAGYCKEVPFLTTIGLCKNVLQANHYLDTQQIDVVFLDINMPLLDGLDFIKSLDKKPLIIITSAYDEYAIKTYELEVLDYLMKPISFPRFLKAINRAFKELDAHSNLNVKVSKRAHIFIKVDKKKMQKIYLDEILIIESLRDYLKITTLTNKYIIHSTLSNFTEKLPSNNFIRIHRSFTIAIDKIEVVQGNSVEIDGVKYVIGRSYIELVKKRILQ